MPTSEFADIQSIKDFKSLVKYLRKSLNWPIDEEQPADDLTFEYKPAELGLDEWLAVKIKQIKQLRPLTGNQPWGVFWIEFDKKQLPVVVMRRILSALVRKQRGDRSSRKTWNLPDLMFISATGQENERGISFAHFQEVEGKVQLRTFGWDVKETHLYYIKDLNLNALLWPADNGRDAVAWRLRWSSAFTVPHRYVPTTAEMLAEKMAEIGRYIREAVNTIYKMEHAGGSLHKLHLNLKMDLISDLSENDFADMYAQTVTYGLFAARATRSGEFIKTDAKALIEHTNPFLRELLEQMMNQQALDLDELGVNELTELLGRVDMEAILRKFGQQAHGEDPVIHFYETFMRKYDPQQKTRRGEFYTPDPVVSFIVRSVDYLLRTEFDCPDGLATSENASGFKPVILDPATGTGTFLKYVIEVIWDTFYEKNKKLSIKDRRKKWNCFVRENVLPRMYAFELKMSPYTIAHMKVGLALQEKGFDFEDGERLQIYLTNALQPAHEVARVDTPALAHEVEYSNEVKNKAPITVIVGNPPYAVSSFNTGEWITNLVKQHYYPNDEIKEHNPKVILDDYVKFLRFSQWRIEKTGIGIIAMITNHGYIDNPTFRSMRRELMKSFSDLYILDLHGNSKKKEISPDGSKDENVFDIQQGVSICFFLKKPSKGGYGKVFRADVFGSREGKYETLLVTHKDMSSIKWQEIQPTPIFYMFKQQEADIQKEYEEYFKVTEIMPINSTGLKTHRDHFVYSFKIQDIKNRIADFRNPNISDQSLREKYDLNDTRDWKLSARRKSLMDDKDWEKGFAKCHYRSFDILFYYHHHDVVELTRNDVMKHMVYYENIGLIMMRQVALSGVYNHFLITKYAPDARSFYSNKGTASIFPLYIYEDIGSQQEMFSNRDIKNRKSNFSSTFISVCEIKFGLTYIDNENGDLKKSFGSKDLLHYMYSTFYSSSFRNRYIDFLRIDFPRLPLTCNANLFRELCKLGKELVSLHLLESSVQNRSMTEYTGKGDNLVAKGYPKFQDGVVMINSSQGFESVTEDVWEFHIGGYQVCEKWLKDRRGRELSREDITHYQKVVVALNETIRLMGEIDKVIDAHGGWPIK